MIRPLEDKPSGALQIDLTVPEGNAYALMAIARKLANNLHLNGDAIVNEMTEGDYENLLEVMEKYFSEYIIMYR